MGRLAGQLDNTTDDSEYSWLAPGFGTTNAFDFSLSFLRFLSGGTLHQCRQTTVVDLLRAMVLLLLHCAANDASEVFRMSGGGQSSTFRKTGSEQHPLKTLARFRSDAACEVGRRLAGDPSAAI